MTVKELHAHFLIMSRSESGKVFLKWLKTQCYMQPRPRPDEWKSAEQLAFRHGRMTLWQTVEYMLDDQNFPDKPKKEKGVFSQ